MVRIGVHSRTNFRRLFVLGRNILRKTLLLALHLLFFLVNYLVELVSVLLQTELSVVVDRKHDDSGSSGLVLGV